MRWSDIKAEPGIVAALDHAEDRPESGQNEKRHWSESVANGCAVVIAAAFRRSQIATKTILPKSLEDGTEPLTPLGSGTSKRIDVTVTYPVLGLEVGVSLKGLNFRDARTGNFDKNLTGRMYELSDEVRLVHEHLPHSFMVGVFFLPLESADDKKMGPSSFARTVELSSNSPSEQAGWTPTDRIFLFQGQNSSRLRPSGWMGCKDLANPRVTKVLERGEYNMPIGESLQPGVFAVMNPMPEDAPKNRLGLAQWPTSPEQPLVTRVLINRIWQQTFGEGLVRSPEDFGLQGRFPTHPELLDWLATTFQEEGWNYKDLVKKMVMSRTLLIGFSFFKAKKQAD